MLGIYIVDDKAFQFAYLQLSVQVTFNTASSLVQTASILASDNSVRIK